MKNIINIVGDLFSGFIRNPLSALGSIFSLTVLFFLMFLSLMFMSFSLQASESAQESIKITFYLKDDIKLYKIANLKAKLLNMKTENDISDFTYITKEDAEKQFSSRQPDRFLFLQKNLGENFDLSASFVVSPKNKDIQSLVYYFLHSDFVDIIDTQKLQNSSNKILEKRKTLEFLEFIKTGVTGIIVSILVGISFIIASFISSLFYARKDEIFVMRLVGATYNYIRIPFIIESVLLTLLALGIGWSIFFLLRNFAITELLLTLSSREEMIMIATSIQLMWNTFMEIIPFVLGGILFFVVITSVITVEHLLRKKQELV